MIKAEYVDNYLGSYRRYYPIAVLLFAYFSFRLFFQQLPATKQLFIYPTGVIVSSFYGSGSYIESEWIYFMNKTQFVLGESCSGTTFFSLLMAYLIYRIITLKIPMYWLLLAYPITLIANAMRVLSSIYSHTALTMFDLGGYSEHLHAIAGTVSFLTCFLLIAMIVEKGGYNNEQ